jgi:N-acetyl-gamma-glutamylphosphate reductase
VSRSAGSTGRRSRRSRLTFSLNQRIDPSQPTRSASTVAGMSGSASSMVAQPIGPAQDKFKQADPYPVTAHAHAWEMRGEEHDERIVVREFACTGCDAVRLESG